MASLAGEHKVGKHRRRKWVGCPDCYPASLAAVVEAIGDQPLVGAEVVVEVKDDKVVRFAKSATPVVVADEVTAVIVHPDAVNPDGQVEVKPVKRSRKVIDKAIEKVQVAAYVASEPVYTAPEKTREAWLLEATQRMKPWFEEAGYPLPEVRVSVGWPAGRSAKSNTIGQCFQAPLVADGLPAIFISPVLTQPVEVLSTLAHELVHAAVEVSAAPHRGPFVKAAKAIGLVGPWTATTAGEELKPKLEAMAEELGPFGHAAVSKGIGRARKVQDTRMLKVACPEDGYAVRTTRKWLDVGLPSCPDGHEMEEVQ